MRIPNPLKKACAYAKRHLKSMNTSSLDRIPFKFNVEYDTPSRVAVVNRLCLGEVFKKLWSFRLYLVI